MKRVLTALLFLLTSGPRAGLAGPEQRPAEIPAVSYTHLDVYKRQALGLAGHCGI